MQDRRVAEMPNYGIDAPGVVQGMFGGALAAGVVGLLLLAYAPGWLSIFGYAILAVALVPLILGVSMLLYAFVGKQRFRDHLLRQRSWRGDETVLDIGAGRGLMAIGAALRVPTGRVIALDIWSSRDLSGNNPEGLQNNAALEGVERLVEIVTADARKIDLPDSSVDVVLSVFCIHNIEPAAEQQNACREITRVLKPGGIAMIADFPGVGGYVEVFRQAGLQVKGPMRAESIAFGIAGYLVATKPIAN
ncbi:MAG: methyltransferase domain-containing protein [Bryobacteraceae bacterium]|nr:methyltransferase domain-containing protein [Bryobacteraceae bacterium]